MESLASPQINKMSETITGVSVVRRLRLEINVPPLLLCWAQADQTNVLSFVFIIAAGERLQDCLLCPPSDVDVMQTSPKTH